jgi:nicotinate-nucleotide pyrophosphorylase (carboxylating)
MASRPDLSPLPAHLVRAAVARALEEDLGLSGDITSQACLPAGAKARVVMASRKAGVVSGVDVAVEAFRQLDERIRVTVLKQDGEKIAPGDVILKIEGNARAVLSAERTALNFMGRMSGIATLTAAYVERVKQTKARVLDTRKTTPGLRAFEKYAVACGGGVNHRFGLFDCILIKDNHVGVAGGVKPALKRAKKAAGSTVKIEIEVDSLAQLDEVLEEGADIVLLDNMDTATLAEAVRRARGRIVTEASGGVTLETVRAIAETGVDYISAGALTHSAPVLDLGLDIELL